MSEMFAMDKENPNGHPHDIDPDNTADINIGNVNGSHEEELRDGRRSDDATLKLYQRLCSSIDKALQAKKNKKSSLMKRDKKSL